MLVTLEEMKNYLRVDSDEDDVLITSLLMTAESLCRDILRIQDVTALADSTETLKTAILYAVSYMYEHREEADHKELVLTLRSLLFGIREEQF